MVLKIEKLATGAVGLSRNDGRTVLVHGALPGEVVDCSEVQAKNGYSIAETISVLEPSPLRREPVCPYYGICGGCDFQIVSEHDSAMLKKDILRDNLCRIGKVAEVPEDIEVHYGAFSGYRHRARFHIDFRNRKWGFLAKSSSSLVHIASCPALASGLNELLEDGRSLLDAGREAMFSNRVNRDTGFAEVSAFEGDDGVSLGRETVNIEIMGIRYMVSANVFFQSNPCVLPSLLSFVKENAVGESIMDLYSGVGTFSALFEGEERRVYAVEKDKACLALSRLNAPSALSFTADVSVWGRKNGRHVDTVIVDPPRTGLAEDAVSQIISWKPERIIYISCNSSTLARDISRMAGYRISKAAVFDFYPGSGHDESAVILDRE